VADVASTSVDAGSRRAGKYLTFFLAGEEYGLEILKVHEIIGVLPITRVPRTPAFVRGVINLRGKVIPIVDLRAKFGMPTAAEEAETCIIVVQVHGASTGIVVDRVSEVADIPEKDIEDSPEFGADIDTDYLLGIAKSTGRVRLLLSIDKVLQTSEVEALHGVAAAGQSTSADDESAA
jgi:purine-binding chemotaxis protein CheW